MCKIKSHCSPKLRATNREIGNTNEICRIEPKTDEGYMSVTEGMLYWNYR